MTLVVAIGTGEFAPFSEKMRSYCGSEVKFCYEMYAASEALFASALSAEDTNYLLIPDGGFFEFIPVDDGFDEEHGVPLLPSELETGKLYEIVVTSLAGLYRYRIKDVVRITGFLGKAPLLQFGYRKDQLINITGVKLTIEHIQNAINRLDELLERGSKDILSTVRFLQKRVRRLTPAINPLPGGFACSAFNTENGSGQPIMGRNFDYKESPCIVCWTALKNGFRSMSTLTANFMLYGTSTSGSTARSGRCGSWAPRSSAWTASTKRASPSRSSRLRRSRPSSRRAGRRSFPPSPCAPRSTNART